MSNVQKRAFYNSLTENDKANILLSVHRRIRKFKSSNRWIHRPGVRLESEVSWPLGGDSKIIEYENNSLNILRILEPYENSVKIVEKVQIPTYSRSRCWKLTDFHEFWWILGDWSKIRLFFFWPLGGTRNEKLTQNRLSGDKKTNIPPK